MRGNYQNAVSMAQHIATSAVEIGDCVIDATLGNGHDTLMLAELVGETGIVYGFDIQKEAINKTITRLKEKDELLLKRVKLINDGHEQLDKHIKKRVDFVMFNLGYLPGKNHAMTTKAESTTIAIRKAIQQLNPGGIITVCVYPGHDEGARERKKIEDMMVTLDQKNICASCLTFENQINNPPLLWILQKNCKKQKKRGKEEFVENI